MKIKRVHIKNFRSIKNQEINFCDQTVFIGANGTGKSTVLHALNAFFQIKFEPKKEDFFAHNQNDPMEITLVFSNFTKQEKKDFESRVHNEEITVTRIFGGSSNENGDYQGMISGNPEFAECRATKGAREKRDIYGKLISEKGYQLPKVTSQAEVEKNLSSWELENPDKCELVRDGGNFFGAKNVGAGKLQNATNFVLIEAVRDATEDANDQKNSAIGQLMDIIVRSAMQQNENIKQYQEEVNSKYQDLIKPSNFPRLSELENALTDSLREYYQDVDVKLNWREGGGVTLPPPQANISFKEDKFEYPVERAGNGIQRAFIISLLHQLLVVKSNKPTVSNDNEEAATEENSNSSEEKSPHGLPSVILAIEEPELYQHPTKQWHCAQVLKRLSSGQLKDTFGDVQVIFCTHAPNFVDLSEFENIRITTKNTSDDATIKETKLNFTSIREVADLLEKSWEKSQGDFSEESTQSRMHIFGTELSEGFFADVVVLVEGATDKAAIQTVAELMGYNFPEHNIAVLSVSGKPNLNRPCAVFKKLKIPVFLIWDSDKNKNEDKSDINEALQRMLGVDDSKIEKHPKGIFESFACFEEDLNVQMKNDFGDDFQQVFEEACRTLGYGASKGDKNPYVISETIKGLYEKGKKFKTLEGIIEAILKCRNNQHEKKPANKSTDSKV